MTPDEAKEILASHDLSLPAKLPPEALEALTFAQSDPELSAWLEEMTTFDRQFASSLQAIEPPENLRAQILKNAGFEESYPVWPQRIAILAIAAFAIVLSAVTILILSSTSGSIETVKDLRQRAALYAAEGVTLAFKTPDPAAAKEWLDERDFPSYPEAPENLSGFRTMGCQTLDWGGHKIGFVCFIKDSKIVHLFIIDNKALQDSPEAAAQLAKIEVFHERQTGGWATEDYLYFLVGSEPDTEIGDLLAAK